MNPQPLAQYRYRGAVMPSAEVSRPVAVHRNAASPNGENGATSATVDILDVIDSWGGWWGISARDVDAALAKVPDVETLYVRINSPGGEATEGVAIANLLRAHPADVRVTVLGLAASAASYIATAGDTVNMAPGTMMMIHEAWNIAIGSAADFRTEAAALDALSDSIASLYTLKAGGDQANWRAAMQAETWYTAAQAVEARLADKVGLDIVPPPAEDDELAEEIAELVHLVAAITGQDSAPVPALATRAAARFDLSMFTHPPAALARQDTQTPAEPPVNHPTNPKEADTMSDTLIKGLRERLGVATDADEATVLAALDETLAEQADPATPPAGATDPAVPDGKVLVSQNVLDELRAGATAGAAARAKQLEDERDEAIAKAFSDGKISADRRPAWKASWDKDPEGTKADLASLPARFPVAKTAPGYAGHDGEGSIEGADMTDDEADALGALAGLPKGALR